MAAFTSSGKDKKSNPNFSAWADFLSLFISPDKTWLRIFMSGRTADETARRVFYPLVALCSALCFCSFLYNPEATLSGVLQEAAVTFISWFIGYFGVVMCVSGSLLGEESKELGTSDNGRKLIMLSLSTLTLFRIFGELLPMLDPLLSFTPIYTIFLITRGIQVIGVPGKLRTRMAVIYSVLIIGIPFALQWLFTSMLPDIA